MNINDLGMPQWKMLPVGESIRDGWWNIDPAKYPGGLRFWEDIRRPREMTAADLGLGETWFTDYDPTLWRFNGVEWSVEFEITGFRWPGAKWPSMGDAPYSFWLGADHG